MKVVILKTNQIKNVADGYARNYLIPNGLAVPATAQSVKKAEAQAASQSTEQAQAASEWERFAAKAADLRVEISAQANDDGTLFAALPAEDIAAAVAKAGGITIESEWVSVTEPIKHTGEHTVSIAFPASKTAKVTIFVIAA